MKRFYEWACEHLVESLLIVGLVLLVATAVFAVIKDNERIDQFASACREIGGVPVHDGRQMACIK